MATAKKTPAKKAGAKKVAAKKSAARRGQTAKSADGSKKKKTGTGFKGVKLNRGIA